MTRIKYPNPSFFRAKDKMDWKAQGENLKEIGSIIGEMVKEADWKAFLSRQGKNLKSDLKKVLEAADCGNAIVQQKGQIGILPQKIDCDYFDFMFGKKSALNMFRGEYMAQYSWAETTLSFLIRMASEAGGE